MATQTSEHRQVLQHNCTIAHKHSMHCTHMQPQAILVLQVLALMATAACHQDWVYFDTDFHPISIDNQCSACISHDIADFIDTPRPIYGSIKGFVGARTQNVQIGTIKWQLEDDQGMIHDHTILDTYYIPDGQVWLLSPQHWMQKTMS